MPARPIQQKQIEYPFCPVPPGPGWAVVYNPVTLRWECFPTVSRRHLTSVLTFTLSTSVSVATTADVTFDATEGEFPTSPTEFTRVAGVVVAAPPPPGPGLYRIGFNLRCRSSFTGAQFSAELYQNSGLGFNPLGRPCRSAHADSVGGREFTLVATCEQPPLPGQQWVVRVDSDQSTPTNLDILPGSRFFFDRIG